MHQTFYIDIDEEITSIVDRLKSAKTDEVIIVVPKRALIIQSLVNLKLLKKEAESLKLSIMVVTQDKLGKLLVEKAGILAQDRLEDTLDDNVIYERDEEGVIMQAPAEEIIFGERSARAKTKNIGSDSYFEEKEKLSEKKLGRKIKSVVENENMEKLTNKELVLMMEDGKNKKNVFSRVFSGKKKGVSLDLIRAKKQEISKEPERTIRRDFTDTLEDEKIENFFNNKKPREENYKPKELKVPSRFWKRFIFLIIIAVLIGGALSVYLFLPKATITINTIGEIKSIDAEVNGNNSSSQINYDTNTIPTNLISIDEEISKSFDVSGKKSVSNQKAFGTITIYNEYSTNTQPLVATTRFESSDGKIFRLKKSISVPGMVKVDNEMKPGAIEAEVIADEPGEAYNIGPTTFTIPGFKDSGNEKYTKFYAKSFKAMTGGGSGSEDVNVVQASDIENAKNKLLTELTAKSKQEIRNVAGEEYEIPEEAISMGNVEYKVSNSVGETAQNFAVSLKTKASAITVKKQDLKDVLGKIIVKRSGAKSINESSLSYEFGKTDADFNNNTLLMRLHVTAKFNSDLNTEEIKQGLLGKNEEEAKNFLSTYPEISTFSISYWPSFPFVKIPIYGKRVEIKLDNN